jgi:hypothetical protein
MYEAGDGRVTRASVLASHLPTAADHEATGGVAEASRAYFGAADHHGLYADPAFQSLLLRVLLGPPPRPRSVPDQPTQDTEATGSTVPTAHCEAPKGANRMGPA